MKRITAAEEIERIITEEKRSITEEEAEWFLENTSPFGILWFLIKNYTLAYLEIGTSLILAYTLVPILKVVVYVSKKLHLKWLKS